MLNFVSSKNTSCFSTSTTFSSSPHLPTLHPHQKNNNNKRTNNKISQVAFNLEGGGEGGVKIVRGDFMMEDFLSCLKLLHLRVFCGHAFVGFSMFSFHQSTNYPEQCDWPSNSIYMTKYLIYCCKMSFKIMTLSNRTAWSLIQEQQSNFWWAIHRILQAKVSNRSNKKT